MNEFFITKNGKMPKEEAMIKIDARGEVCPVPLIKTKKTIEKMAGVGQVQTVVDNKVAVENLTKLAEQKGYKLDINEKAEDEFELTFTIGDATSSDSNVVADVEISNTVVVISSDKMGEGNDELGQVLIKGFIYALSELETLPQTILFYNGGAKITTEDSPSLEDLKELEKQGVYIYTCGTCLDYYNLKDKLAVGQVTNMYNIVEILASAEKVIRP